MNAGQDTMNAGQDTMNAGQDNPIGLIASDLDGTWETCVDEGVRSVRYAYTLIGGNALGGQWDYTEWRYGEGQCLGDASMLLSASGAFTIGLPIDAYYESDFTIESLTLTPSNANAASLLSTLCPPFNFTTNQALDLSTEGCERLNIEPLSACPIIYRIMTLDGDRLHLGQAAAIGVEQCTNDRRPQALGTSLIRR